MKIRNASRKFKTWISALWKPAAKFDWLETHYELLDNPDTDEMKLLMAKREKAKKQKKAWKPIQAEIEKLRTRQLRGEA